MENKRGVKSKVTFKREGKDVIIPYGKTLLYAAYEGGLSLDATCGGKGTCGKCKVKVRGSVSDPTQEEKAHLSSEELQDGLRLACQARALGDVIVDSINDRASQKILVHGVEEPIIVSPSIQKIYLELPLPSLEDQRSDFQRLKDTLKIRNLVADLEVIQDLPQVLRGNDFKVTAVLKGEELIGVEEGDTTLKSYGLAFDIGTTTVVGTLMNIAHGSQLGVSSGLNGQADFGADVISRINFAKEHPYGLRRLKEKIIEVLNEIINDLLEESKVNRENIYEVVVVGNTCMQHLFLEIDPINLALMPYVSVTKEPMTLKAKDLGISINKAGDVYMLPSIAGFVGADTVAVGLATYLEKSPEVKLVVDIGTNGEILLGSSKKLLACSTAAGPAFEGAQIKYGMRGTTGAIEAFQIHGDDISYKVIDNVPPKGICGSGLIDIMAELLKAGIIDGTGRILSPGEIGPNFRTRIVEGENGYDFVVAPGILLTQGDVRQLQLAKGAIYAGIQILKEVLGTEDDEISQILLTGAFGNYIRKESAKAIGLLPDIPLERIKSIGNAAGVGAKMALLSIKERDRAVELSESIEYVELSNSLKFQEEFMNAMYFSV